MKYFAIGVALLLAGAVVGAFADPYLPSSLSNAKKGYETGFATAKSLVENSAFGNFFKTPDDVRSLSGTVTAINGNRISLHLASTNPFDDPVLLERTVLVATTTQIFNLTLEKTKSTTSVQSFTPTKIDVSALKVGDTLMVASTENVKTLEKFTASEIQIQSALTK